MKISRILALLLGLVVLAFVAKSQLEGAAGASAEHTAPRRQLDNVRDSARRIEDNAQRRVDATVKKADPE